MAEQHYPIKENGFLQAHSQALFFMLLAGGRDPGECWSRGSQIFGASL